MKLIISRMTPLTLLLLGLACDSANDDAAHAHDAGKAEIIGDDDADKADTAEEREACGTLRGFGTVACAGDLVCDFDDGSQCGGDDTLGTCTSIEVLCKAADGPVCGCDGQTYADPCKAALAGTDVLAQGPCLSQAGDRCGAIRGVGTLECDSGLYCDFTEASQCGGTDQPGTCTPVDAACEGDVSGTSCGCDGVTYADPCAAAMAGVDILHPGAC